MVELGETRPGIYYRDRGFTELPKAREASPELLRNYYGIMRLRHPGQPEAMITFEEGRRSADDLGTPPPPALRARIPVGMSAEEAMGRFHPKTDVRLGNPEAVMMEYRLPEDAGRLKNYTGELWSLMEGFDNVESIHVWFRNGRVTLFKSSLGI